MSSDPSGPSVSGAPSSSNSANDIPIDISHMEFPTMKAASNLNKVSFLRCAFLKKSILIH